MKNYKQHNIYFFTTLLFIIFGLFSYYNFRFENNLEQLVVLRNKKDLAVNFKIEKTLIYYIVSFIVFYIVSFKDYHLKSDNKKIKDNKKLDLMIMMIIILNYYYTIRFGLGLSNNVVYQTDLIHKIIAIFLNRLNMNSFFYIYMCLQKKNTTKYIINVILFVILNLLRGWSGFLLVIILILLYKKIKGRISFSKTFKLSLLSLLLIKLYQYVDSFKYYIRIGVFGEKKNIIESIIKFSNRLSGLYDLYFIQYYDSIYINLFEKYYSNFNFLKEHIVYLIPLKNTTGYISSGHILQHAVYGHKIPSVNGLGGIFGILLLIYKVSKIEFIITIFIIIGLYKLTLFILKKIQNKALNFIYFYFWLNFIQSGNVSSLFVNVTNLIIFYIIYSKFINKKINYNSKVYA